MNNTNRADWLPIADTASLSEGINPVSLEGVELVIVRKRETLSVFAGRCIHQEAPMAQGILEENHLVCSKHLWRYSLETGELEGEPGIFLQKFESQLQDQTLEIRRDAFDQLKELYNSYDEDDDEDYRP
jgi:nitrite reductase/ring-hydroxylating ferredoxin subunit